MFASQRFSVLYHKAFSPRIRQYDPLCGRLRAKAPIALVLIQTLTPGEGWHGLARVESAGQGSPLGRVDKAGGGAGVVDVGVGKAGRAEALVDADDRAAGAAGEVFLVVCKYIN